MEQSQNCVRIFHFCHACYTPAQIILIEFITLIIFGEVYKL